MLGCAEGALAPTKPFCDCDRALATELLSRLQSDSYHEYTEVEDVQHVSTVSTAYKAVKLDAGATRSP